MGVMVAGLECAELASDAHPPPDTFEMFFNLFVPSKSES
jgi:hypothetical protein